MGKPLTAAHKKAISDALKKKNAGKPKLTPAQLKYIRNTVAQMQRDAAFKKLPAAAQGYLRALGGLESAVGDKRRPDLSGLTPAQKKTTKKYLSAIKKARQKKLSGIKKSARKQVSAQKKANKQRASAAKNATAARQKAAKGRAKARAVNSRRRPTSTRTRRRRN